VPLHLTIIRHGETAKLYPDQIVGSHDIGLTPAALQLQPKVAQALAALKPQLVLTSHLKRCTSLARAVADLSGARLVRSPQLAERNWGTWTLKRRSELAGDPEFERWMSGAVDVKAAGSDEDYNATYARMVKTVEGALTPDLERVVWVSHAGIIKAFRVYAMQGELAKAMAMTVDFHGVAEFERDDKGKWCEISFNRRLDIKAMPI